MSSKNNKKKSIPERTEKILLSNPRGLAAPALARILKIPRNQMKTVLNKLHRRELVIQVGNRYYSTSSEHEKYQGYFKRKISGRGQIFVDDLETPIQISRKQGYNLVDGDLLEVIAFPDRRDQLNGIVISVARRREDPIAAYLKKDSRGFYLEPLDPKLCRCVEIGRYPDKKLNNQVVLVQLKHDKNPSHKPQGTIIKPLGKRFDFGVQTSIITLKFGIRDAMPQEVIDNAEHLLELAKTRPVEHRKDLRDILTITVDPVNARDFDDALSLKTDDNGYQLGVHIADVSHYVPQGSLVDQEAYKRGTSVYLPERAIHMLPEKLATNICSLRPEEDRLAVTILIDFDKNGKILDGRVFESFIRSNARLTYQEFLDASQADNSCKPEKQEIQMLCQSLAELCRKLLNQRVARGVLDLDMPEPFFELDENDKVIGIHKKKRSIAEMTIEEFMIAANIVVAKMLHRKNVPYLRRVHETPDPSEISELKSALAQLGLDPPVNPLDPDQVRVLLAGIENNAIRSVASHRILRAMRRAVYSSSETGHFGLALEYYTQFTSPIRRYPDLDVHRSIKAALKLQGYPPPTQEELTKRARELSEFERRGQEAEWDAQKIEKIHFMRDKIGEEFMATVTNVMEYGAYIELDEPFVDGFIPVAMLDDYFNYEEHNNQLVNSDRTVILKPGVSLKVKVELADLDRGMLDFTLA